MIDITVVIRITVIYSIQQVGMPELPAAAAAAARAATSVITAGEREALLYVCFINLRCMN